MLFLGYWALFNLGFLHRDISEGNVLALSPAEQFDWEDYDLDKLEPTDEVLIKSQELLRKLLNQFRGRGPTGMLSDFDLHAQHSLYLPVLPTTDTANPGFPNTTEEGHIIAAGSHFSTPSGPSSSCTSGLVRPREEDTVEDTREPKRRKVVSHPDSMHTTTQANLTHTHPSGSGNAENQLIDFRTGTPAFMSIRVITLPAGEKYHHSFLDDMESFFWLILWSAAAHLDNGVQHPTARAQNMLDLLNQSNPFGMAGFKKGQLADCVEDIAMRIVLQEFGNSWASDRIFTNVIVNFGKLVYRYHFAVLAKKDPSPVDVFPAVVKVFLDALSDDSE
ncbi:hypothetical protein OPQ81_000506 [Rhizoctonia solani]|nr:hypothetical protein OPQ81_000506 [Rhizoctonia solani]